MDTIKSYIYGSGQSGTEPVSGETGKGTAAEPYDQGNQEGKEGGNPGTKASGDEPTVGATNAPRPEHETDKTGVTSLHSNDPHGSDIKPSERDENRPNVNAGGFSTAEPSVGADPSSGQTPQAKQQSADKPLAEPTAKEDEARSKKKDEGEELLKKRDPNDHSGEPMHVHGDKEKDQQPKPGQEGGGQHGKEEGTGEQWIKSSGLAAEGGDFDATKPGAGREANRLLEEKGVHKDKADDASQSSGAKDPDTPDSGKKASKIGKIKDKLHIGKH